jgi:hypothetical protein
MGNICEHELKTGTEYDLYAKLNATIAWDKETECFVIKRITGSGVLFRSKELQEVIDEANRLEKAKNTTLKCNSWCKGEVIQNVRS